MPYRVRLYAPVNNLDFVVGLITQLVHKTTSNNYNLWMQIQRWWWSTETTPLFQSTEN
uniref:Uncharacterized protein n=1 Tax=Arundo donax TaxID=35708 RepID=A0A0A9C5D2_ARUDO